MTTHLDAKDLTTDEREERGCAGQETIEDALLAGKLKGTADELVWDGRVLLARRHSRPERTGVERATLTATREAGFVQSADEDDNDGK